MVLFLCSVSISHAMSCIIRRFSGINTCLISLRLGRGLGAVGFYADGGGECHIAIRGEDMSAINTLFRMRSR